MPKDERLTPEEIAGILADWSKGSPAPTLSSQNRRRCKTMKPEPFDKKMDDKATGENLRCSHCESRLDFFNGLEYMPAGFYCPKCNDALYNEDGEAIAELE